MGTWNKFLEHVSTFTFNSLNWFCKLAPSAHIRYICENSMIAHPALVLKDTFAPRFARTRQIIRYRATATLRRPQNKQYSASK